MVNYTYIVARLNALEAEMPDSHWFQRLARGSSGSLLGSLRDHLEGFDEVGSLHHFERGLTAEKRMILELLTELVMDRKVNLFLRAGYDFDNMCFLWKAGRDGGEPVFNYFGLTDPEEVISRAAENNDIRYLPGYLKELYQRLEREGEGTSLAEMEQICEKAKWNFLLRSAPSRAARFFTTSRIDTINIKNFIRAKRTGLMGENARRIFLEGGKIEAGRLKTFFKETENEFLSYLETTDYRKLISWGLSGETPLWKIDPILTALLIHLTGESRYRYFDIAPVLYHLLLRERNEQIIRTVVTCKLNEFPQDMIEERVDALLLN